ncbi:MAG: precorrin-6A reductase [Candidatus Methanomethylophilaceae archaeon]
MVKVLIFSGTSDGRALSDWLVSCGADVHMRVATGYGASVVEGGVDVQVGSAGGTEGIASLVSREGYDAVIDATHPYAVTVSEHIREGCAKAGVECIRLRRRDTDLTGCVIVPSVDDAVEYLSGTEGVILSTIGVKALGSLTRIPGYRERVVARVLSLKSSMDICSELGFEGRNLICAQGPFTEEMNHAMIVQTGAKYLLTKDSGHSGGAEEKLEACRRAGITAVVIGRPPEEGMAFGDVALRMKEMFASEGRDVELPKRKVSITAVGMGGGTMTADAVRAAESADVLIGAERMLSYFRYLSKPECREYLSDRVIDFLDSNPDYGSAAVLVSGDVGFYSAAKKLIEGLDRSRYDVEVICGISSMVYLASRMGIPWQDVYAVSTHGREFNIVNAVDTHRRTFTLLSGREGASSMLSLFKEYGLTDVTVTLGMDLGSYDERIVTGTVSELESVDHGDLCVALIDNPGPRLRNPLGIPDEEFIRGDAPMTKSEVRTLSVAKLGLEKDSVIYDIGAGTSSVSVEMALAAPEGKVYAIEMKDASADLIEENKHRFRAANIEVVRGKAPDSLAGLPVPTHAFIGGSSGNLKEIVSLLLGLNPGIRMVINAVTLETVGEIVDTIDSLGLVEEEITMVSVSRSRKAGRYHLMNAQNPVYIAVVRGR